MSTNAWFTSRVRVLAASCRVPITTGLPAGHLRIYNVIRKMNDMKYTVLIFIHLSFKLLILLWVVWMLEPIKNTIGERVHTGIVSNQVMLHEQYYLQDISYHFVSLHKKIYIVCAALLQQIQLHYSSTVTFQDKSLDDGMSTTVNEIKQLKLSQTEFFLYRSRYV